MITSQIEKYFNIIQQVFVDVTLYSKNKIRSFGDNLLKTKYYSYILFFLKSFKTLLWLTVVLFLSYIIYIILFSGVPVFLKIILAFIHLIAISNLFVKITIIWLEK